MTTFSELQKQYHDVRSADAEEWGQLWSMAEEFDPLATTGLRLESPPALEATVREGSPGLIQYRVVHLMTRDEALALPSTLSRMLSFTPTGAILRGEPFTLPAHHARDA